MKWPTKLNKLCTLKLLQSYNKKVKKKKKKKKKKERKKYVGFCEVRHNDL